MNESPQAETPASAPPQDQPAPVVRKGPSRILLFASLIAGAAYGLAMRMAFEASRFKSPGIGEASGGMLVSFVFLVPLVIGIMTVLLVDTRESRPGFAFAFFGPWAPMVLFCLGASVLLLEGAICIAIVMPVFLLMSSLGGMAALLAVRFSARSRRTLPALLALPLLAGHAEKDWVPEDHWARIDRAIEIGAPPARVWQLINHPTGIRPEELSGGLAYRIGVPYPIEANTLAEKVGGARKLVWQKGVTFDERITAIEPQRRICWTYEFRPDSFPPAALDDHVLIGGHYFDLGETCYELTSVAAGTRLAVSVKYRVSTNFNWYAGGWGRVLVGNTAETILGFYKRRGEAS